MNKRNQRKKWLILAVKIALSSSIAIFIAQELQLINMISAGTIALITLMTTKWETVKLSFFRFLTFWFTTLIAWLIFSSIDSMWIAFGVFVFILALFSDFLGWRATIAVNSVIGGHFLVTRDFSIAFIMNELALVLIGIIMAILLNLFHDNRNIKKNIIASMRYTEKKLQLIMENLADYLSKKEVRHDIWENISSLEQELHVFLKDAYEYQENTFQSHPSYFIDYFEMRLNQFHVLYNLQYEMKKIQTIPKQSKVISEYIRYLMDYVIEINAPYSQIEKLNQILESMKREALPKTREEFESRAVLYHILMDLEDFLMYKLNFVISLDEKQIKEYWT